MLSSFSMLSVFLNKIGVQWNVYFALFIDGATLDTRYVFVTKYKVFVYSKRYNMLVKVGVFMAFIYCIYLMDMSVKIKTFLASVEM